MRIKTFFQLIIIGGLCSTLGYYFVYGDKGLIQFKILKQEVEVQKDIVKKLQAEVQVLELKLQAFNENDFEKEKIAREDLHMGYTNEFVYILAPKSKKQS
ncbi:MAG: septum formation initiator family protein [bacterium]